MTSNEISWGFGILAGVILFGPELKRFLISRIANKVVRERSETVFIPEYRSNTLIGLPPENKIILEFEQMLGEPSDARTQAEAFFSVKSDLYSLCLKNRNNPEYLFEEINKYTISHHSAKKGLSELESLMTQAATGIQKAYSYLTRSADSNLKFEMLTYLKRFTETFKLYSFIVQAGPNLTMDDTFQEIIDRIQADLDNLNKSPTNETDLETNFQEQSTFGTFPFNEKQLESILFAVNNLANLRKICGQWAGADTLNFKQRAVLRMYRDDVSKTIRLLKTLTLDNRPKFRGETIKALSSVLDELPLFKDRFIQTGSHNWNLTLAEYTKITEILEQTLAKLAVASLQHTSVEATFVP